MNLKTIIEIYENGTLKDIREEDVGSLSNKILWCKEGNDNYTKHIIPHGEKGIDVISTEIKRRERDLNTQLMSLILTLKNLSETKNKIIYKLNES